MIWGETHEQRRDREYQERMEARRWRRTFALFPVTLQDGRRVWLRPVETAMVYSVFWATDIRRYRLPAG